MWNGYWTAAVQGSLSTSTTATSWTCFAGRRTRPTKSTTGTPSAPRPPRRFACGGGTSTRMTTCRFAAARPGSPSLRRPRARVALLRTRRWSTTGSSAAKRPRSTGSTPNGSFRRRPWSSRAAQHVLTTNVTRRSDGGPIAGWTVRYEVAGGGASLGYGGGNFVDVPTDAAGRASVEVSPTGAGGGATTVNMTLIRPPQPGADASPQLEIGSGSATISWGTATAPAPVLPGPVASTPLPGAGARRRRQAASRPTPTRRPPPSRRPTNQTWPCQSATWDPSRSRSATAFSSISW